MAEGIHVTPRPTFPGQRVYSLTAAAIPPQVPSRDTCRGDMVTARKGAGGKAAAKKASTTGAPDLVQLLTPAGELVEHPDYKIDLSPEEYRGLYRDMVLVRRIDAEGTALQR